MARADRLPQGLGYLQRFASSLARRPADSLHEDLDPEPLIRAVRAHFREDDRVAARAQFRRDVDLLQGWLEAKGQETHPAHWILGFLSGVELDELLDDPPPPPPPTGPALHIETPPGWKSQSSPGAVSLRRGPLFASLLVCSPESFGVLRSQLEAPPPDLNETVRLTRAMQAKIFQDQGLDVVLPEPPRIEESRVLTDVVFGPVVGRKLVYRTLQPTRSKSVSYLLTAPGGQVQVMVGNTKLGDVDETPVESCLASLRIAAAERPA